jgi:drug/metabolite transporter (DMT)-like permease
MSIKHGRIRETNTRLRLTYGPAALVTPLTATLPLWVVPGSKLFLRDLEKFAPRIVAGAILVVMGTIAISLAKP